MSSLRSLSNRDLPYLISKFTNYVDLVSLSRVCILWYDRLEDERKRRLEEIPWSITVEYHLDAWNKPVIHFTTVDIGLTLYSWCESCPHCDNKIWQKTRYNTTDGRSITDVGYSGTNGDIITSSQICCSIVNGVGGSTLRSIIEKSRSYQHIIGKRSLVLSVPFKVFSLDSIYTVDLEDLGNNNDQTYFDDAIVRLGSFSYPRDGKIDPVDMKRSMSNSIQKDLFSKFQRYSYLSEVGLHLASMFNTDHVEMNCNLACPVKKSRLGWDSCNFIY